MKEKGAGLAFRLMKYGLKELSFYPQSYNPQREAEKIITIVGRF